MADFRFNTDSFFILTLFLLLFVGLVLPLVFFMAHKRRKEKRRIFGRISSHRQKLKELELKNASMLRHHLREELQDTQEQLEQYVHQLLERNEHLQNLKTALAQAQKEQNGKSTQQKLELEDHIRQQLSSEKDWLQFLAYFERLYPGYMEKLKEKFPALTAHEIRVCSLIKIGLSSKEIASILNISPASVNTARYRLRKKLGIDSEEVLIQIASNP